MNIETLLSIISGGLAGAYLSCRFNSYRYKTELSLTIIEKIETKIELIEEVYSILQIDVASDGNIWGDEPQRKIKFDKIITVGNYLDTIAFLYLSYNVHRTLLERSHVCLILDQFTSLLKLKQFLTSEYNIEKNSYFAEKWGKSWPYLYDYKMKKQYNCDFLKFILFG